MAGPNCSRTVGWAWGLGSGGTIDRFSWSGSQPIPVRIRTAVQSVSDSMAPQS